MNILLLGAGGREHALAWKLRQSKLCTHLFISPGNPGTAQLGTNINMNITADFDQIKNWCLQQSIALVIVGPEEPLVKGIVDAFTNDAATQHISIIGPSAYGAQLEGSKAFAKAFMQRHNIPTAAYQQFDNNRYEEGLQYLQQHTLPIVLKADGLAAGKGVIICQTHQEAIDTYQSMLKDNKFGAAGSRVVVESFLSGIELSVFALTDGTHYVLLPEAKDYKRIGEADSGLNTGGMGAVSPVPFASKDFMSKVEEKIVKPTIVGLAKEKINYKGFVFFGLIKVEEEPFVIEYNCRMGDPETEVVIPRLKNDLVELMLQTANGKLNEVTIETDARTACTVMAVSGGYPELFEKGFAIQGLDQSLPPDSFIFHAGTTVQGGQIVTNGGRVLCVTAFGENIEAAVNTSQQVLANIKYDGLYYRKDIGYEFVKPEVLQ
jgi:phosphoribosylamine---glycine ligase